MPLAHILAPQLAKKVEEIAAQLPGTPNGYLQQTAPVFVARDPNAKLEGAGYDNVTSYLQRAQVSKADREAQAVAGPIKTKADMTKAQAQAKRVGVEPPADVNPRFQGPFYHYQDSIAQLPGYLGDRSKLAAAGFLPVPSVADMQAQEQGTAIAPPVDTAPYKRGTPLQILPGEPAAMTEGGQGVDRKGKKLGYIDQEALHPGIRYLDRRPSDVGLGGSSEHSTKPSFGQDIDAQNMLGQMYGQYLKDYQDNNNKFFPEMFVDPKGKKLSKERIENAKAGVKVLLELQNGTKT